MAERPCESSFAGAVFRQSAPRYAEITDRTLAASARTGGRYNPPGEFGAIYVSLDPDTPLRELRRQALQGGVAVADLLPRTLFAAEARLQSVVDLACEEGPAKWGLTAADLASDDWRVCQAIARQARAQGCEAIRFRSATGAGENLAVFLDRLAPGSSLRILRQEELYPDRP
jgi:RES domain-containing protein